MNSRILVVEDDDFLRDGICEMLEKERYDVQKASSVEEAKEALAKSAFSLIMLDVMLPDGSGFDLCRNIRSTDEKTPILFLTACDDEIQIVRGLDSGADDYVTKPFRLLELLSRVRALLRRTSVNSVVTSGDIAIDSEHFSVKVHGEGVIVTPIEFQVLSVLMRNSGLIVTREALLTHIWDNNDNFIDDNTLSVHISRLREKIGADHIVTVRGVGYRFES